MRREGGRKGEVGRRKEERKVKRGMNGREREGEIEVKENE